MSRKSIKLLIVVFVLMFFVSQVAIAGEKYENQEEFDKRQKIFQEKLQALGRKVLKRSHISNKVTFKAVNNPSVGFNIAPITTNLYLTKNVNVTRYQFEMIEYEDELAALIAVQLGGIVACNYKRWNVFSIKKTFELTTIAESLGLEFMVNAGYNPYGMLLIYQKIYGAYGGFNSVAYLKTIVDKNYPQYKHSRLKKQFEREYMLYDSEPMVELDELKVLPYEQYRFLTPAS